MNSKLVFFALLIQLNVPYTLLGMEFEFSYRDEGLNVSLFGKPIYDQETEKKKAEDIKNFNAATEVTDQEIKKANQENNRSGQQITKTPQKIRILEQKTKAEEQKIKRVENNSRIKAARLKKAREEL